MFVKQPSLYIAITTVQIMQIKYLSEFMMYQEVKTCLLRRLQAQTLPDVTSLIDKTTHSAHCCNSLTSNAILMPFNM